MTLAYDIDVLARTVWAEARGEQLAGQAAVAWVVKNRSRDAKRRWPRTIAEVCKQRLQFSCWNPGDPNLQKLLTVTLDVESFARAHGIVTLVLANEIRDYSKGANHYHTTKAPHGAQHWPPTWAVAMEKTAQIGAHEFLRA